MTPQEFTQRTGLTPTPQEFNYIHALYMNTALDKDEFCSDFKKHGASNIMQSVYAVAVSYKLRCEEYSTKKVEIAKFLLGKACAYNDTDIYNQAVELIGQKQVVICKIKMGLPLWDEDQKYLINNLK